MHTRTARATIAAFALAAGLAATTGPASAAVPATPVYDEVDPGLDQSTPTPLGLLLYPVIGLLTNSGSGKALVPATGSGTKTT
ncbi:hypothetical protein [Nocardia sp. CA-145437]|uniref:hypothetical protein n=1 Tax=Nocardia sp. CA-145437 TaxID=3239980 RepID=UPI003D98C50D